METIEEIFAKYDTDKNREHHYGPSYAELFNKFDRQGQLDILEVGTQRGGSLRAWKDYFPNANVTGVDIEDFVTDENRSDTVNYVLCDIRKWQTNQMFDIIIDDGSHSIRDVAYVVNHFSDHLKKSGIMVIEDVSNPELWLQVIMASLPLGFNIAFKDLRPIENRLDDFLILIAKL